MVYILGMIIQRENLKWPVQGANAIQSLIIKAFQQILILFFKFFA